MTTPGRGAVAETVRAFVAIRLPEAIVTSLVGLQANLRQTGLRAAWSRPATMHLTLRFLGDVPSAKRAMLQEALAQGYKACAPLCLEVAGAGVFPNRKRPRVIYAGVRAVQQDDFEAPSTTAHVDRPALQAGTLAALRKVADDAALTVDLPRDNKSFRPHITVGRVRDGSRDGATLSRFNEALDRIEAFQTDAFDVSSVSLFTSTLHPGGAVHTCIATFGLGPDKTCHLLTRRFSTKPEHDLLYGGDSRHHIKDGTEKKVRNRKCRKTDMD